jgi:hypothetical protein
LGSVEKKNDICCFRFSSGFAPFTADGKGGMSPGFGCDDALVTRIVNELQSRKLKRGNVAQIRKLEYMLDQVIHVARTVPTVIDKLGGPDYTPQYPPVDQEKRVFETTKFDVSRYFDMLNCTFSELELGQEEATYTINRCFGLHSYTRKREYAELGYVESSKKCFVCRSVDSDISEGGISPGFGCDKTKVLQIVQELRERMAERGNIGQMRKQERMYQMMYDLEKEWPMVMQQLGLDYPPSHAELSKTYGDSAPDIPMLQAQGVTTNMNNAQQVEEKTFDITNNWEACPMYLLTCGLKWRQKTMQLKEDMVVISDKLSDIQMPYAQMGSVDFSKECCCFYSVNDESPGCGCQQAKVLELAEELQKRKVARGNIAQVKMLEAMQSSSRQMNIEADLILEREGIAYPPSQQTINKVWKGTTPHSVANPTPSPHIGASEQFEQKEYDVTNWFDWFRSVVSCRGPLRRKLTLEPEEMYIETTDWCSRSNERTPYAQLGSVETENMCHCCSVLPDVANPKCGCSKDLVDTIANDLQERKVKRGNIAQMKMQENILHEISKLAAKADLLCDQAQPRRAPAQEVMAQPVQGAMTQARGALACLVQSPHTARE